MEESRRRTAFLLIAAGLYLAIGYVANFFTSSALLLAVLGFAQVRAAKREDRKEMTGYALIGLAALIVMANHWWFIVTLAAAAVVWFLYKSRSRAGNPETAKFVKQHIAASIKWGKDEPWVIRSTTLSVAIAEIQIDLTNAFFEEKETILEMHGMIGDIDIIVPEEVGVLVNAHVTIGQIQASGERGAGAMNRLLWRSNHYDTAEHRVILNISYLIADVDVKML